MQGPRGAAPLVREEAGSYVGAYPTCHFQRPRARGQSRRKAREGLYFSDRGGIGSRAPQNLEQSKACYLSYGGPGQSRIACSCNIFHFHEKNSSKHTLLTKTDLAYKKRSWLRILHIHFYWIHWIHPLGMYLKIETKFAVLLPGWELTGK